MTEEVLKWKLEWRKSQRKIRYLKEEIEIWKLLYFGKLRREEPKNAAGEGKESQD